jgi:DNA-binding response OmpR family regulator
MNTGTTTMEPQDIEVNRSFARGKRFVVLDDDAMVSEALIQSLQIMGGEVECFDNAEKALQHPRIGNADCYIVDYMLPGDIDGINFLLRLRQQLHKPVCAVMMSGNTSPYFIRKAELFDWPVLHKPVNMTKLISRLREQYSKGV